MDYLTFDAAEALALAREASARNNAILQKILDTIENAANNNLYSVNIEIARFASRSSSITSSFLNGSFDNADQIQTLLASITAILELRNFTVLYEEVVSGSQTIIYYKVIWADDLFPETLSGLLVWLKPNVGITESGGAVTEWADLTRNQVFTSSGSPTKDSLTKGVLLDGSNDYLETTIALGTSPTIVAFYVVEEGLDNEHGYGVYTRTDNTNEVLHFKDSSDTTIYVQYPSGSNRSTGADTIYLKRKVVCCYSSPTKSQIWLNTTKLDDDTYSGSTASIGKIRLGTLNLVNYYFPGVFISYLLYNTSKTDQEITDIITFLMNEYAVSL